MASRKHLSLFTLLVLCNEVYPQKDSLRSTEESSSDEHKIISSVEVRGLTLLPEDTILNTIPYQAGETFNPTLTGKLIHALYNIGYFKQIKIFTEPEKDDSVKVIITLEEKTPIKEIIFEGNKHLPEKDIFKKTDLEKKPAIEEHELAKYCRAIEKLYKEKNYHFAEVVGKLKEHDGKGIVTFKVREGVYARVQKVRFTGNKTFTDKKLRSMIFTREDWVLGILDKSGTFNPMATEQDRYTLEYFYQSNGYMNAKVGEPLVDFDTKKRNITVTFPIEEGEKYTISSVSTPGAEDFTPEDLADAIPVRTGQAYSREGIRMSIEKLRDFWGKQGYIYADVEPAIQPDDEKKTVDLTFYSDPGSKVFLNCIHIIGNEKTRDKVIRRQLTIEDGDLITSDNMEMSKTKVGQLGYFDQQEGVNWKIERLDKTTADLNLLVKEIKTGKLHFQANYGGTPNKLATPGKGINVEFNATERNLLGLGLLGQFSALVGQAERSFLVNFTDPFFCDKAIQVGFDGHLTHSTYDELRQVKETVREKRRGGTLSAGFVAKNLYDTVFLFDVGIDQITHMGKTPPIANVSSSVSAEIEYQRILDQRFIGGAFTFFQISAAHDTRNHHLHISRGHKVNFFSRIAVPILHDPVGFYKIQGDIHWYTPVIGDTTLVYHFRAHAGIVMEFNNKRIPFRELYNIGGQSSVRGWEFGQLGPMWFSSELLEESGWQGESIGGRKGFFINNELIFPLTEDFSLKGSVFYDGGTGWDTTDANLIDPTRLKNNSFDYRQSIGIGIRLLNPQPMRVDWGFKLDKRDGEPLSEVHFSTYYDF